MRARVRLVLSVAAATTAFASLSAPAADAFVHRCNLPEDGTITVTSVRNMTCAQARAVERAYRGSISRRFRMGRFSCYRTSGMALAGEWRCVRGSRAFRFDFAD
jgi:hypothetical protein